MTVALSHYETLTILNADLNDEALKAIIGTATAIIAEADGVIHKVDEWGRRRLAYPILKKKDGFYFLMTYSSSIEPRREMERRFKLNEDVMRFQTIAIDEAAVEVVKESILKEAAVKEAAEKEAAVKEAAEKEAAAKEAVEKEAAAKEAAEKEAAAEAAPAPEVKEPDEEVKGPDEEAKGPDEEVKEEGGTDE